MFMQTTLLVGDSGVRYSMPRRLHHYIFLLFYIAYKKEGCEDDPGWCFRDAVGNSLPASFHSYGQPSETDSAQPQSAALYPDMQLPSVADILASAQKLPVTLNSAWDALAPLSKTYKADERVSPENIVPQRFKRSVAASQQHETTSLMNLVSYEGMDMTPSQRSDAKGYSDGFLTSQIFASHSISKLGFIGQYIADSIGALGPAVVAPRTEGSYQQGFMRGLRDGEGKIAATLKWS
jgi:glucan 1,3-beta-glucosidase